MSFLSSHRLHWGAHDAITHHIPVQLGLIQHEEPTQPSLRAAPAGTEETPAGAPMLHELREARPGLVDEPGP